MRIGLSCVQTGTSHAILNPQSPGRDGTGPMGLQPARAATGGHIGQLSVSKPILCTIDVLPYFRELGPGHQHFSEQRVNRLTMQTGCLG